MPGVRWDAVQDRPVAEQRIQIGQCWPPALPRTSSLICSAVRIVRVHGHKSNRDQLPLPLLPVRCWRWRRLERQQSRRGRWWQEALRRLPDPITALRFRDLDQVRHGMWTYTGGGEDDGMSAGQINLVGNVKVQGRLGWELREGGKIMGRV